MPILNYSTKIDSYKTITELQQILSKAGAKKFVIDNDSQGNPSGVTFAIDWNDVTTFFALPCNFQGILILLRNDPAVPLKLKTEEQANRVGWRILKDWVLSQLALVESDMAKLQQIFLPYGVTKNGKTVYEMIDGDKQLLLTQ